MELKEIECDGVAWVVFVCVRIQARKALVNAVISIRISQNVDYFLIN